MSRSSGAGSGSDASRRGVCAGCGFDWDCPSDVVLDSIDEIHESFRSAVADIVGDRAPADADEALLLRPDTGVWSPLEYVAHMRDVAAFYRDRIERVLVEDRPSLPVGMRFAEMAVVHDYRADDIIEVLAELDREASSVAATLCGLDERQWQRVGVGESGERTMLILARRLAHEARHHLGDITGSLRTP